MEVQWPLNLPQQIKGGDPSSKTNLVLRAGDLLSVAVLEVDRGRDALISFGQFKAYARLPLPVVTGQTIHIQVQQADEGLRMVMLPYRNGHPASTAQGGYHRQSGARQPEKAMLSIKADGPPPSIAPSSDNLQIRLFEPVSDRPFLSAHAHMLRPGESVEARITGFRKDGLMLVDFGKFKAFAKIDVPVREGQALPLTVVKTDQGIAFSVGSRAPAGTIFPASSPPEDRTLPPEVTGRGGETPASPATSTAQAPSATILPDHQAGMAPPSSPSSRPTAAEMARFRDQIGLLLGDPDPQEKPSAAPLPPTTQAALTRLQQLLRPVSTTGDTAALMAGIREFVENSGVYFEKRVEAAIRNAQERSAPMNPGELAQQPSIRELMVKDLKPNLLILKQHLESQSLGQQAADHHVLETMKGVVQRTLAHIEQQQLSATEKPVDPDLFQAISHLLLLADHRRDARLKVYYAKKGRRDNDNKTPRVALLLEMDRMGTLRADLWMVGKDLNVTFFVQTEETKAAIIAVQDEIKTALNQSFNTVAVSVVVSEKKIDQFDEEDLYPAPRRLLDLSI